MNSNRSTGAGMTVEVAIPETLRRYGGNTSRLETVSGPLPAVLVEICTHHPALGKRLLTTDGQLMAHLAVCLRGKLLQRDAIPDAIVQDGDLLEIMFVASGG